MNFAVTSLSQNPVLVQQCETIQRPDDPQTPNKSLPPFMTELVYQLSEYNLLETSSVAFSNHINDFQPKLKTEVQDGNADLKVSTQSDFETN